MTDPTPLLTVDEAAAHLRCSRQVVFRAIARGELPSLKPAKRRLIRADDLEGFTARLRDEHQSQFERPLHIRRKAG